MKKRLLAFMLLTVVSASAMAGCTADMQQDEAADISTEADASETASDAEAEAGSGYLFKVNGIKVGVDMNMDALLSELGDADSVYDAVSCAGQGTAYIYDYGSYEIETYPQDDQNLIAYIVLKDDTVATAEGIDLSMTKEDIIGAYGEDYTENDHGLTYESDCMKLNFIFEGEDMISIEYVSPAVG